MKQRPPGVRETGKLDSVKHGCLLAIDFLLLCSLALSGGTEMGPHDQVLTEAFTLHSFSYLSCFESLNLLKIEDHIAEKQCCVV